MKLLKESENIYWLYIGLEWNYTVFVVETEKV